jgi:hypothetical protein
VDTKSSKLFRYAICLLVALSLVLTVHLSAYADTKASAPETKVHGDLLLGYYPVSDVYKYVADVNVHFNYGSYKESNIYFGGGILTLIKKTDLKSFQPDRYRGTLETGIQRSRGKQALSLYVKHQSFHDIDRFDGITESYEMLGVRYAQNSPWNPTFSLASYVHKIDVDYKWDFSASVDNGCLGVCRGKSIYGAASIHYVGENGQINRDNFFDYNAEVGFQSQASIRYFLAYRQTHDIDRFNGTTDHAVLVGMRYGW